MNARFYAPEANAPGEIATLPDDEAQHLARVLRLKAGQVVTIFNGRGSEFGGVVESVASGRVQVRLTDPRKPAREAAVAITLAQAVVKGDKMDDVIRDAVMIGVAAIQPIVTARSEITCAALDRGRRRERWQRIAVSSAKQSGRAVVPPILDPLDFGAMPQALTDLRLPGPALMLIEPRASAEAIGLSEVPAIPPRETTLLVGPEGGWTAEEIAAAANACTMITMGARTLRADATALVAIAALFARWGEF